MAPIAQHYSQDVCGIGSGLFFLHWGGQKVGLELIEWSLNSTTQLPPPRHFPVVPSPQNCPSLLSILPKLLTLVNCCLGWAAQRSRASYLRLGAHHDPIILVRLLSLKTSSLLFLSLALLLSAVLFTIVVVPINAGVVDFFVVDMVAVAMRRCHRCCHCHHLRHRQRRFVDVVVALVVFLGGQSEELDKTSQDCIPHGAGMKSLPLDWSY